MVLSEQPNANISGAINILYCEFSSLNDLHQHHLKVSLDLMTYCKDSKQRRLARILQPDHGYVHFGRPYQEGGSVRSSGIQQIILHPSLHEMDKARCEYCDCWGRWMEKTYQKVRSSQS